MEHAVQLSPYIFFDLTGARLRCFSPAPVMEHTSVPYDTQVTGLLALHRTRLSRTDAIVAARPADQVGKAMVLCDRAAHIGEDADTVSDAGTSGVGMVEETTDDEAEDEVASLDELLFDESFVRKIDELAGLVGMEGAYQPAAVLGEVVRLIQEMERETGRCDYVTKAVRS
ncbi:hypothetical protein E2562_039082 [Oryza meyeriana var. granulata]|uniref:Uncharacterized protein n=1 Tax=Oryza meyeriana var. granulata TaxID=110450 RepID=A0A6G1E7S8_9ORYZ|nr:hypothetical protein E2562_039082 [Oryza meyeriana var. granulata]